MTLRLLTDEDVQSLRLAIVDLENELNEAEEDGDKARADAAWVELDMAREELRRLEGKQ